MKLEKTYKNCEYNYKSEYLDCLIKTLLVYDEVRDSSNICEYLLRKFSYLNVILPICCCAASENIWMNVIVKAHKYINLILFKRMKHVFHIGYYKIHVNYIYFSQTCQIDRRPSSLIIQPYSFVVHNKNISFQKNQTIFGDVLSDNW